jgi:hypothetical protein
MVLNTRKAQRGNKTSESGNVGKMWKLKLQTLSGDTEIQTQQLTFLVEMAFWRTIFGNEHGLRSSPANLNS